MNKKTKTALAVAAVMLIIGATLLNIARGRGEDVSGFFNGGSSFSFTNGGINFGFDQKGYTVCTSGEESFAAAEVKSLDVDWISGAVNVEPWDGKTVVIREKADAALTEGQRMRWKLQNGELSVIFCANGETKVPDKTLTVLLPRELELRDVDVDAVSAAITLTDLRVTGEINTDATSGSVRVTGCVCDQLDCDAVSGSVSISDTVVSGLIDADTTSGAVAVSGGSCAALDTDTLSGGLTVEGTAIGGDVDADSGSGKVVVRASVSGEVDVDTTSGEVELRFSGLPASVDVSTTSGAVTLAFPKGTAIDLDFDTGSGKLRGTMNNAPGGLPVNVDTGSGSLTIEES